MHVLPLPFGLALALIPRREADKLRTRKPVPVHVSLDETKDCRDQILGSHYFIAGRFPF
jgi:hypothetical protein